MTLRCPLTLGILYYSKIRFHFGEVVQNFELKRVGGAPKHPYYFMCEKIPSCFLPFRPYRKRIYHRNIGNLVSRHASFDLVT